MNQENQKKDETSAGKSFAELFEEQDFVANSWLQPGQKVEAVIVKITKEWIFLDLGGKSEGYLDRKELLDDDGNLTVQEGNTIQAYFLSARNNEQLFTTKIGKGSTGQAHLEEAYQNGIPVEGIVEKEIKGGFEVKIAGGILGFCPYSQMGLRRVKNPDEYVGQRLTFTITEYGEKGRNIILSNRAVLEEELQQQKEALKESLREGMRVKGAITSIKDFGAFLDIGIIEGLLPISEISWGRVEDINELLTIGQELEVVVMDMDWEKNRFSFSLKETLPDPWETVEEKFPEGSCHTGKAARVTNFGAFITLEAGIDGLIHISKLGEGKRINHPSDVIKKGQTLEVRIETVDKENKRLSLSLARADQEEEEKDRVGDYQQYVEKTPKSLGTLEDMLKGKLADKSKE